MLDIREFNDACDPSRPINYADQKEQQYYVNFASVRGGELIKQMAQNITIAKRPTCQLFTGYIGCGKSTELLRLKAELEEQKFHVVCFMADEEVDLQDVEISDILLGIASQILKSLAIAEPKIEVLPTRLQELLQGVANFLNQEVTGFNIKIPQVGDVGVSVKEQQRSLSAGIVQITTKPKTKNSQNIKDLLHQHLEPQVPSILDIINQDLIKPVQEKLKQQRKADLVVIIDNLDRVADSIKFGNCSQPEYLFINQGESLRQVNCHKVYTIPAKLLFSRESQEMTDRLGGGKPPKFLPMIPVELRDGSNNSEGILLLQEMVMRRAFPTFPACSLDEKQQLITEVFDSQKTLDELCRVSGGHVRHLLGYLQGCLSRENPPLSRDSLDDTIREERIRLCRMVQSDQEWKLLAQVAQTKKVAGQEYPTLLKCLLVFEYLYKKDNWFDINPVLKEAEEFKAAYVAISQGG